MKVLFLVPYPVQGASNRFRVHQFIPLLEARGLDCRVRPFYSERLWRILYRPGHLAGKLAHGLLCCLNRCLDLFRALGSDLVFIHREAFPVGPAWFEGFLRLAGKPYIYDFDDAVFLPNVAEPNRLFGRLKFPGKVRAIARWSRICLAGNRYLAEFAERCGARDVRVAPTVVDTELFSPAPRRMEGAHVVLGWIGSPTTIRFVEPLRTVIQELLQRYPGRVEFRVVGGSPGPDWIEGTASRPWTLETEVEELRAFDIGLMPMPDDEWTRGKCAFKAIEYLAVGVPAVCSPVGMNLELVEPGINGFLPESQADWLEALGRLIEDPGLRTRLGRNGRDKIEKQYSVKAVFPGIYQAILDAAKGDATGHGRVPDGAYAAPGPLEPGMKPQERMNDHR